MRKKVNTSVLLAGKQNGREKPAAKGGRRDLSRFYSIPGGAPAGSRRADGRTGPPTLECIN